MQFCAHVRFFEIDDNFAALSDISVNDNCAYTVESLDKPFQKRIFLTNTRGTRTEVLLNDTRVLFSHPCENYIATSNRGDTFRNETTVSFAKLGFTFPDSGKRRETN